MSDIGLGFKLGYASGFHASARSDRDSPVIFTWLRERKIRRKRVWITGIPAWGSNTVAKRCRLGAKTLGCTKIVQTECDSIETIEFIETKFGGASRDRTDDLIVANDALSQLSYSPILS